VDFIAQEIYSKAPQVLCFSCYIWNIELVKEVLLVIRKISPHILIVIGGPEVSFPPFELLGEYADIIVLGEGEATFNELCGHFLSGRPNLAEIKGIAYYEAGTHIANELRKPLDLNSLAFPYKDLNSLANKIVYYESSRGCPFSCAFCISSVTGPVRFLDIEKVKQHIDFFIENKVKLVKFVDRTFNCDAQRALKIWRYMISRDTGDTGFHFEIGADLLTDEHVECLKNARPGLIQFEAGVQSTNPRTLEEVCRSENFERLHQNIMKIKALNNIHVHLDLIAGLPFEDFLSFKKSFNDSFSLRPDMLQLGFLKLLKGSALRDNADKYGMVYREKATYEVLFNDNISFGELLSLKGIENVLELYYNSGLFSATLEYMIKFSATAFDFFYELSIFWNTQGLHRLSHSKQALYEILLRYVSGVEGIDIDFTRNLLKFDMFMNENVKNLPDRLQKTDYTEVKNSIYAFFADTENAKKYFPKLARHTPKQLSRMCHIEKFDYNVLEWLESGRKVCSENYCLFVYGDSKTKTYSISLNGGTYDN